MGIKNIGRPKEKKARYAISNVSLKGISKIIKEFEKFPYEGSVRKMTKHEPNNSYFYLSIRLANCKMKADTFNYHVDPERM